jgi:uncharacterized protein YcbK (DUF882 family)
LHSHEVDLVSSENAELGPEPAPSRRKALGLSSRGVRFLDAAYLVLLSAFVVGWIWVIVAGRPVRSVEGMSRMTRIVAASLTQPDAPSAAFLTDAALTAFFESSRGVSGRLRAQMHVPGDPINVDSLPDDAHVVLAAGSDTAAAESAPPRAGIWRLAVSLGQTLRPVSNMSVITMRPFSEKRSGRIGTYRIGSWPGETSTRGLAPRYHNPRGFIEVTRENQDTHVSEHFKLRHFLTKDQPNVWPKYLVLEMRLIDKLELILADLESHGYNVKGVTVMSGFRTPQYNAGGGNTSGRANLSRHMYGDAADIYIDNNGDGQMDDLNGDGKVDINDARVMLEAVERVERKYPELVGGAGLYKACCGHGPFIHVDTRGYRARWTL